MRKFTLSAGAFLLVLSAFMPSCSKQDSDKKDSDKTISTTLKTKADTSGVRESPLASYIRYVDTQRILLEYTLAQEVAKDDSIAQLKLASLQNQLSASLNSKAQSIQEKAQRGGYINESAYNAEMASLQKQQQDAENSLVQRQRDYATTMMNRQAQMHDSIKSVIDDICHKQKLDAILTDQSGLYFNPSLDITNEVIAELNRRYKPAK